MTTIEVICNVDIEKTPYSFHAHAVPDGIEINPGDTVQIHGAPTQVLFGDKYVTVLSATVTRAGPHQPVTRNINRTGNIKRRAAKSTK